MNKFQNVLAKVLEQSGNGIEIVAAEQNRVHFIYQGRVYNQLSDLPQTAQFAVIRSLTEYRRVYNELQSIYGQEETIQRMCWCLFGSMDSSVDINVATGRSKVEVSTHCRSCQYSKPFCCQVVKPLTLREQQCFSLMRLGKTDKEIALLLNVSYSTVVKHFTNGVEKFRELSGERVTRAFVLTILQEAGI